MVFAGSVMAQESPTEPKNLKAKTQDKNETSKPPKTISEVLNEILQLVEKIDNKVEKIDNKNEQQQKQLDELEKKITPIKGEEEPARALTIRSMKLTPQRFIRKPLDTNFQPATPKEIEAIEQSYFQSRKTRALSSDLEKANIEEPIKRYPKYEKFLLGPDIRD